MHAVCYVHAYVPFHNAGAETTIHDLNRALVAAGWDVTVLISRKAELRVDSAQIEAEYDIDGVHVVPFVDKHQPGVWFPKADVVISHLDGSERAAFLTRHLSIPLIQIVHNTMWQTEGYLSLGTELAVYNTDWVRNHHESARTSPIVAVATSGQVVLQARQNDSWPGVVVHPPIEAARYALPGNNPVNREYVTLINLWAGAGDHHTGKGPHILYALAEALPDQKFMGVVGGYGEQDIRSGYKNVTIVEHTPDVLNEVYAKTKVLLMPSRYESFGRVAIEAAASGIPTLAHPTPGLTEALGPGGLFCDLDNPEQWLRDLSFLLRAPGYYREQSLLAYARSAYWSAQRETELAEFVSAVNCIARS